MSDLISKSRLKNELSKIPSEMGLIKKACVMQAINKQKTQDGKVLNEAWDDYVEESEEK